MKVKLEGADKQHVDCDEALWTRRAERRRFIRFDVDVQIIFRLLDGLDVNETVKGKAKNISADGLCIVTGKEVPRDRPIELDIFLPGRKRPVRLSSRVSWTHRLKQFAKNAPAAYEAGIKLYTTDKYDENTLLRYYCEMASDNLSHYLPD